MLILSLPMKGLIAEISVVRGGQCDACWMYAIVSRLSLRRVYSSVALGGGNVGGKPSVAQGFGKKSCTVAGVVSNTVLGCVCWPYAGTPAAIGRQLNRKITATQTQRCEETNVLNVIAQSGTWEKGCKSCDLGRTVDRTGIAVIKSPPIRLLPRGDTSTSLMRLLVSNSRCPGSDNLGS